MICARCGAAEVEPGTACERCGAPAVAPDLLDSVLSMPAEPVPEDLDGEPIEFSPLTVTSVPVGPMAGNPEPQDRSTPPEDALGPDRGGITPPLPPPSSAPPPPPPASTAASPAGPPLPRRTPIDATAAQWGPRDHPPAVSAPPPPHPLDAPPVARVKRPSATGSGLPGGMVTAGPASVPSMPTPTVLPPTPTEGPAAPPVVPERPSHPRVRRWFGRGSGVAPGAEDAPEAPAAAAPVVDAPATATTDRSFEGAPDGVLDGVVPEPDTGAGIEDPGGIEAAASRLSAGARRSALAPLAVVSVLLEQGEVAEAVVQGELQHRPAVAVLTDRRVVVANDRRWAPDVRTFELDARLAVHGWQDDRRATLVFVVDGVGVVLDAIADRPLARDLAQRIRRRCSGAPATSEPS